MRTHRTRPPPAVRANSKEALRIACAPAHRGGAGPPLLLIHGFAGTWRVWELVLPALERRHDVLAVTLPGHAGGPPLGPEVSQKRIVDVLERALDQAGWATAHVAGNSLGGYLAFKLAERNRARSVVALAPAGGWAQSDRRAGELFGLLRRLHDQAKHTAPHAEAVLATAAGRRAATRYTAVNFDHIPLELLADQLCAAAVCEAPTLIQQGVHAPWTVDPERIRCQARVVWGTEDRLLPWPAAATRYRGEWLAHADWVVLDGVGHCPQLDVPLELVQLILGFTGA